MDESQLSNSQSSGNEGGISVCAEPALAGGSYQQDPSTPVVSEGTLYIEPPLI
jgi:hypothetical protein